MFWLWFSPFYHNEYKVYNFFSSLETKNNNTGIKSYRKNRLIHICHVLVYKFPNGIGRNEEICHVTQQANQIQKEKEWPIIGLTQLWTNCQQSRETYNGLQCSRTGQGHVSCTELVLETVLSIVRGNDNIISHQSENVKQMMSNYSLSSSKFQWLIQ